MGIVRILLPIRISIFCRQSIIRTRPQMVEHAPPFMLPAVVGSLSLLSNPQGASVYDAREVREEIQARSEHRMAGH